MNKSLILVSRKPIVVQIFTLVCKKLNIQLEILTEAQLDHKVDILVIDSEFIDDRFNMLKSYTKLMGAISKEELPFGSANDFKIPLPFLPSSLEDILDKQLEILHKRNNSKIYVSNVEVDDEENTGTDEDTQTEPAVKYLESLAQNIANDIEEQEEDDSIVSITSLNKGGVLDSNELSNIKNIMTPNPNNHTPHHNTEDEVDTEWMDLSSIIDKAMDEVNAVNEIYTTKFDNNVIKVLLSNFELEELTPLLNKLDQDIIDSLTDGNEINLQIKLGQAEIE